MRVKERQRKWERKIAFEEKKMKFGTLEAYMCYCQNEHTENESETTF